ncbi:hypothetical protein FACS1894120_4400 [Clostridia bacterium]|nr:hypothetical protein FACS1894120_4400 [Clostridia bacterium]
MFVYDRNLPEFKYDHLHVKSDKPVLQTPIERVQHFSVSYEAEKPDFRYFRFGTGDFMQKLRVKVLGYVLLSDNTSYYLSAKDRVELTMEIFRNIPDEQKMTCNFIYWNHFCNFFNQLVKEYNIVTKEIHYFRNELNRVPPTLDDLVSCTTTDSIQDRYAKGWKLTTQDASVFHMYGKDGEYNLKIMSDCGKYEAVYNKQGNLIDPPKTKDGLISAIGDTEYAAYMLNPQGMMPKLADVTYDILNYGTYNFSDFGVDASKHFTLDIVPYTLYGNFDYMPSSGWRGTLSQYETRLKTLTESKSVVRYHEEIKGLLSVPKTAKEKQWELRQIRERRL